MGEGEGQELEREKLRLCVCVCVCVGVCKALETGLGWQALPPSKTSPLLSSGHTQG